MRIVATLILFLPLALAAEDDRGDAPAPDGMRPGGTLSETFEAPKIPAEGSGLQRQTRNYPQQPPMIPHGIRGYQVDRNFNQCLSCHSRQNTVQSGAPMVSITHFTTREGQTLAAVSPRRYFCTQCHVPQLEIDPAKISTFRSMDEVLQDAIETEQGE